MNDKIKLTLLEKSVKLPIGTRRIYGSGKNMQWFRKAPNGKWEYDGQVSSTERAEEEKKQKAKAKAKKLRLKSKNKKKKILADIADSDNDVKKKDNADSNKPAQADIDKMPKKQQLYFDDATTDRARHLCDKTGILCIDKTAEDYLENNLNTIFKMDKQQQHIIDGLDSRLPTGKKMDWLNDQIFVSDTLTKLKEQRDMWLKLDKKGKLTEHIKGLNPALTFYERDEMRDEALEDINNAILNIEGHENDQIVLSKMRALEKGMRGFKTIDGIPGLLMDTMMPDIYDIIMHSWNSTSPENLEILKTIGISNEEQFENFKFFTHSNDLGSLFGLSLLDGGEKLITDFSGRSDGGINSSYKDYDRNSGYTTIPQRALGDEGYIDPASLSKLGDILKKKYPAITQLYSKLITINNPDNLLQDSNLKYTTSFGQLVIRLGDRYSGSPTATTLKVSKNITWREIGTALKSITRAKNVDWSKTAEQFKVITDTAKIMGNTPVVDSQGIALKKMQAYHAGLTPEMKNSVVISGRLFHNVSGYFTNGDGAIISLTGNGGISDSGFIGYKSAKVTSDRTSTRRYYGARTIPGDIKQGQYIVAEKYGETKQLKSALRTKALRLSAISSGNTMSSSLGQTTHTGVSIALAIGANWQNRKLAKKTGVIPKWEWGGARPLQKGTILPVNTKSHSRISSRNSSYGTYEISSTDYAKIVTDIRNNGIIKHLGLTSGVSSSGQKQVPKLVIRTNKEGSGSWQKKVDESWTHKGSFPVGSIKVKNVFDVMYHDYFPEYKDIERTKDNVQYGFHGTDFEAGASIIKGGYKVFGRNKAKAGRMLGDGIYVAKSSSKAAGYLHSGHWGRGGEGVLLWNRVSMGKVNTDGNQWRGSSYDPQYDTIYALGKGHGGTTSLEHDEWCVRNAKAVVPITWIEVGA